MLQEPLLSESLEKLPVFYYKVVFCNGRPLTRSSHASHFAQKSGGNKKKIWLLWEYLVTISQFCISEFCSAQCENFLKIEAP